MAALSVALVCGTPFAGEPAANPAAPPPLRILFIGNSLTYTNGLPSAVAGLAWAAGETRIVETQMVAFPSASLQRHWDGNARDVIRDGHFDYVVLQTNFWPSAGSLHDVVAKFDADIHKSGAKTILFLHWSGPRDPSGQAKLDDMFYKSARDVGAAVAPVGPAWLAAGKNRPVNDLYNLDGMHPTSGGTYLAACVFYSVIFDKPPPENGDNGESGAIARKAAWEAVTAMKEAAAKP